MEIAEFFFKDTPKVSAMAIFFNTEQWQTSSFAKGSYSICTQLA
jgi:hypothetical protein